MMALLSPRLWLALAVAAALAFTHGFAYKSGRAAVRANWDAAIIAQQEQAAKAEAENRRIESERQQKVIEAQNEAAKRAKNLQAAADNARSESERLRGDLAAIRGDLPKLTRDAVNRYADAASVVFDQCQRSYQDMAANADRLASDQQTLIDAWPK